MDIISIIKQLHTKVPGYDLPEEAEKEFLEYLTFLRGREDLLQLAQEYHDGIWETNRYTLIEVEELKENDGREQGLLFMAIYFARYELLDEVMAKRGMPVEYKLPLLTNIKVQLQKNYDWFGSYGFRFIYRSISVSTLVPTKFYLGRLICEITNFNGPYEVYRSKRSGADVPMARPGFRYLEDGRQAAKDYEGEVFEPTLEIADGKVSGYTFDERGCLIKELITLPLDEYEQILAAGTEIISMHIPAGGGKMTPESIDEAVALADKFFNDYYPEKKFPIFMCSSWLMDTAMKDFLDPESNIIKFQNRFRVVLTAVNTYSLYWHIFGVEQFLPLEELKPKNSFQQKFWDRAKAGIPIYSGYGYILR